MTLRDMLSGPDMVRVALINGPVPALAAEDLGFDAIMVGGAVSAMYEYGVQDGLITPGEVIEQLRRVRAATTLPIIADLDDVGGVPPYVRRYVRAAEDAGASAFVIEDIDCIGRWRWSSELNGWDYRHQRMREAEAAADLVRVAVAARRSRDTVVIARTDALINESLDAAMRRAGLYVAAGADLVMIIGIELDAVAEATERLGAGLAGIMDLRQGQATPAEHEPLIASGLRLAVYINGMGDTYSAAMGGFGPLTATGSGFSGVRLADRIAAPVMVLAKPSND